MKEPSIVYSKSPFIASYDNVLSQEECQILMDLAKANLQPSTVVGGTNTRKSDTAWLPHSLNEHVQLITNRIASIAGQPLSHAEQLQIVRYQVGGRFDAHLDTFSPSTPLGRKYLENGGQRILTALLYLNTVRGAGGETFFPSLNFEVAPSQGNLLVFEDCYKNTNQPHPLSLHGSHPLRAGEKWIATLWFREKPRS
ncbi:prolyl hydroxylase family protein [Fictibacillus halophilus]|uniref:prolyl hydroxylase family protein n=1 Tax=Fictibacillus halophilus TaxID=1610490 RepID=UPI001CF95D41|nr:2OG-Fe(II) oxygenase [Fictibacillus halophilus]